MAKMIARTIEGQEFLYDRRTAHEVSERSAARICDALNKSRYKLTDNQVWHIYDMGWYERDYTEAGVQAFKIRNGTIYERRS